MIDDAVPMNYYRVFAEIEKVVLIYGRRHAVWSTFVCL